MPRRKPRSRTHGSPHISQLPRSSTLRRMLRTAWLVLFTSMPISVLIALPLRSCVCPRPQVCARPRVRVLVCACVRAPFSLARSLARSHSLSLSPHLSSPLSLSPSCSLFQTDRLPSLIHQRCHTRSFQPTPKRSRSLFSLSLFPRPYTLSLLFHYAPRTAQMRPVLFTHPLSKPPLKQTDTHVDM